METKGCDITYKLDR